MARMTHDRHWLKRILDDRDVTATELAVQAGVHPSTLTRFLQGTRDGHELAQRTVRKIEAALSGGFRSEPGFADGEAVAYAIDHGGDPLTVAARAIKAGRNSVDAWEIRGDALQGLRIHDGDVLMVDLNREPTPGQIVCAQIVDWQRGRANTVFRLYEPPFLLAASTDPRHRRPETVDGRNVSIVGTVIARLSPGDRLVA